MNSNFTGAGRLLRFTLRRERLSASLWVVLLSGFSILLAPMLAAMFDAPARQALILTVDNPAMIAMLGPIYGVENYTPGAMYFNMMVQWVMLAAGVMNLLLVIRHTRTEEQSGRADLLLALPTGRFAQPAAAMLLAFLLDLAVALLTGLGIAACGVESMGTNGALLYGAAVGAAGFVFAALAAVFAQLCATSQGAVGLSVASLGGLYLLRGAGDIGSETLALVSPLGLAQRTKAWVQNDWLPILILLAEALALTALAFALAARRDIRSGLFPARRGKAHASALLRTPEGLAFRLLRGPFWGWVAGMLVLGASYGSILGTIDTFVQSSDFYAMVIGLTPEFSTAQMFVSMVTSLMALCAVAPVLIMVLKFRSEEKSSLCGNVLSAAVSRSRYLAGYVAVGLLTAVLTQCATALGLYLSATAVLPDAASELPLSYLLKANLVYVPALWVMLGLAVLLVGLAPRFTALAWGYLGFSFAVTFLGRLPDLVPDCLKKLTPFGYIPDLPADDVAAAPLAALCAVAAALITAGFAGYRRRDITAG